MKFGLILIPRIGDAHVVKEAEDLGYHAVWWGENHMLWSDIYPTMALAARATSRIRLGTGVSVPVTRIAPVTAHSIASINQIAPGRTFVGIGSGGAALRLMGQQPLGARAFEEYVRVLCALLHGEECDYSAEGATHSIRFLNAGLGFRNVEDRVPIYVAAQGPKALKLAGRYGDGLVSVLGIDADTTASRLEMVEEGAAAARQTLASDFHYSAVCSAVLLRPGEKLTDERVIDVAGPFVTSTLHRNYGLYWETGSDEHIPDAMSGIWEEYRDFVESQDVPPDKRFLALHEKHTSHLTPSHRRFITPELIEAHNIVGSADEIAERLGQCEAVGLREISLLWGMENLSEVMRDFTEVTKRF